MYPSRFRNHLAKFPAFLLLLVLAQAPALSGSLRTGDAFPRSGGPALTLDGRPAIIDNLRGDAGTLILFTSATCDAALSAEAGVAALVDRFAKQGVVTIFVETTLPSSEAARAALAARATSHVASALHVIDDRSHLTEAFGATHVPEAILFDAGGTLVYRSNGATLPSELERALAAVVTHQPAAPMAATSPAGCPIAIAR